MVLQMPTISPSTLSEPETWRELLAMLISDPQELQRCVEVTQINSVTLKRWSKWKTNPRPYQLRPLLIAFPKYRDMFIRLIRKEFSTFSPSAQPDFLTPADTEKEGRVPTDLYEHVVAARSTTPPDHLFWVICNHVLRPALIQLDSQRLGMGIWVCQCVLHQRWDGRQEVLCLRERIQFGTTPWTNDLAPALLVGSESLAGYAVVRGLPAVCQNVEKNTTFLPLRQEAFAESAVAFPLSQGNKIAGSLFITSTQTDFFTRGCLELIERYAQLVSLAFHDGEFCDRSNIHLQELPSSEIQRELFVFFRQRVTDIMNSSDARTRPKSILEAEALVWSQFAEELAEKVS